MNDKYGPTFWQAIGLLSARDFDSKSELAKELSRINGKPVARQQVYSIIKLAVEAGLLKNNPFPACPQMRRDR